VPFGRFGARYQQREILLPLAADPSVLPMACLSLSALLRSADCGPPAR